MDVSGKFFIDGQDLWAIYRVFIEESSAELLRYPPKKESITHDWRDANGIDVDLTAVFFAQREVAIVFAIITENEEDFWLYHDRFIALLVKPGLRRLQLSSHGQRSYHIFYKECNNYSNVIKLQGIDPNATLIPDRLIAHKFTIVFVEPEPTVNRDVFLVDDSGRHIIT